MKITFSGKLSINFVFTFRHRHPLVIGVQLPHALQLVLQSRDLVLDRSERQRHVILERLRRLLEHRHRLRRVGLELRRVVDRVSEGQDREPGPLVAVAVLAGVVVQRRHVQTRLLRGDRDRPVQDDLEEPKANETSVPVKVSRLECRLNNWVLAKPG